MTADRIKEELQWLRVVFQLAVAIDAGLVAYLVQPSTSPIMGLLAAVALMIVSAFTVYVAANVNRLLRALEGPPHDVP